MTIEEAVNQIMHNYDNRKKFYNETNDEGLQRYHTACELLQTFEKSKSVFKIGIPPILKDSMYALKYVDFENYKLFEANEFLILNKCAEMCDKSNMSINETGDKVRFGFTFNVWER